RGSSVSTFYRCIAEFLIGPFDEVLHVGPVLVPSVVLSPGQLTVEKPGVDGRHRRGAVVFLHPYPSRAQKAIDRLRGDDRHETALLVEPQRIPFLWNPVADEDGARRAQRNQLV